MVYGCGNNTVKFLVFFFNFLIFICGAVILILSLVFALAPGNKAAVEDLIKAKIEVDVAKYTTGLYLLAAVGAFLMIVGFLGCCGAACESKFLLGCFFVIVLILFLVQLGVIIAAFVLKDKFYDEFRSTFAKAWDTAKAKKEIKDFMNEFKCCGITEEQHRETFCQNQYKEYKKTCYDEVRHFLDEKVVAVLAVAIVVLVIEVLAMIFTCVLCSAYDRRLGYYA